MGSDYPISVQSMCTTKTHDVNATLQQIAELTAAGCDIVRVACPRQEDADALAEIARHSQIPVIADIHFQPKYIFAAIDAGCAAVRVNPGNIKEFDGRVGEVAKAAGAAGIPIRIGVNAGSLDKRFMEKYGKATPEALVESALWEASLFEEHGFGDIKISVKHNDPVVMVAAYELLAAQCDYPLHLGVTEAGPAFQGTIKSAVAFGALLSQGIGDTIRVSLSAPPVEEVKVGNQILESLNLRPRSLEIVSCPSCGRAQVDVYTLANEVSAGLDGLDVPLRVAVMGCVVNGPGEAREADLGVASGNGKGQIFVRGEVIKTVPEAQIVETLIEEAMRLAAEHGEESGTTTTRFAYCDRKLISGQGRLAPVANERITMSAPPIFRLVDERRVSVVRDAAAVWRVLDDDPVGSCMVAARVADHGVDPNSIGGELWTRRGADESLCFAGANLIPLRGRPDDLKVFADEAMSTSRRCSSLVGRAELVMPMWRRLEPAWGPARDVRDCQPLMALDRMPSCAFDTEVRQVRPDELDAYLVAAVDMFIGEVGVDPRLGDGGRGYRRRVAGLIAAGRAWARFEHGEVVFKAEVGSQSPAVGQIQGVWVHPERRGQGLGTAGTATLSAVIVGTGRIASLYVNDFNAVARATYARVGFRDVGTFATVLLD